MRRIKRNKTGRLPGDFESLYRSKSLKEKIADNGMWGLIPCVTYPMNSPGGIQRLKENHLLFKFIDDYFPNNPFAFEPNMEDGRYVFLPDDVGHQGIGITASLDLPGFLEIGHFWYPCEFTEETISIGPGQAYVPMYSMKPGAPLADKVRAVYMGEKEVEEWNYCTFPFDEDSMVTLSGDFLDRLSLSVKTIRKALKDADPAAQRNGEGLISFMQSIME